jgi:hypothetical protein
MLGDVLAVVMESKRNRRALCRVDRCTAISGEGQNVTVENK